MSKIEIFGMAVGFVLLFGSVAGVAAVVWYRRAVRLKLEQEKAERENWTLEEIIAREG